MCVIWNSQGASVLLVSFPFQRCRLRLRKRVGRTGFEPRCAQSSPTSAQTQGLLQKVRGWGTWEVPDLQPLPNSCDQDYGRATWPCCGFRRAEGPLMPWPLGVRGSHLGSRGCLGQWGRSRLPRACPSLGVYSFLNLYVPSMWAQCNPHSVTPARTGVCVKTSQSEGGQGLTGCRGAPWTSQGLMS